MSLTIANVDLLAGDGRPARRGWLGMDGDRITAVGTGDPPAAHGPDLDGGGLALCPGFIDLHGHTDALALANPALESKLLQGVTTEVGGNCGFSVWPPTAGAREEMAPWDAAFGLDLSVTDLDRFAERLAAAGLVANMALLAGHGNLRAATLGYADRPAAPAEIAAMQSLLGSFLDHGAWGLSFGLAYPPGMFAATDELVAVAKVVRGQGFLAFHLRSESDRGVEAVEEALAVGRRAGVPVHLSHHKALGRANWGRVRQTLALLDKARGRGEDVTADAYPYTATSTSLSAMLPNWAQEGGAEGVLARLGDMATRQRVAADMTPRLADPQWLADIMIARTFHDAGRRWEGRSLADLAAAYPSDRGAGSGRHAAEAPAAAALFDLLLADRARTEIVRQNGMAEEDVSLVLRHPWVAVASDATARSLAGPLAEGRPHPRAFGTFPRVLGRYVREQGALMLPEAVRKMTGLPAARLGLVDRGRLAVGCRADLVLFDPAVVADRATFIDPVQPPVGIAAVWVNGEQVVEGAGLTGRAPGRYLRRAGGASPA